MSYLNEQVLSAINDDVVKSLKTASNNVVVVEQYDTSAIIIPPIYPETESNVISIPLFKEVTKEQKSYEKFDVVHQNTQELSAYPEANVMVLSAEDGTIISATQISTNECLVYAISNGLIKKLWNDDKLVFPHWRDFLNSATSGGTSGNNYYLTSASFKDSSTVHFIVDSDGKIISRVVESGVDHNSLNNLQGGLLDQYYHLTLDQHDGVVASVDNIYYVSNYTTLNDAIADIGSNNAKLVINEDTTITTNITIQNNILLEFIANKKISGAFILTFKGHFSNDPNWQIFGTDITFIPSVSSINHTYAEWWGVYADGNVIGGGGTDDAASIMKAYTAAVSCKGTYRILAKTYAFYSTLTFDGDANVVGDSMENSILYKCFDGTGVTIYSPTGNTFKDFYVCGKNINPCVYPVVNLEIDNTGNGIDITNGNRITFNRVQSQWHGSHGINHTHGVFGNYTNCVASNNGEDGTRLYDEYNHGGSLDVYVIANVYDNFDCLGNGGWGFHLESCSQNIGRNIIAQQNISGGVCFDYAVSNHIECYTEANGNYKQGYTCTVDAGTDVVTVSTVNDWITGQRVKFTTNGTLPGGITICTSYYIRVIDSTSFTIYDTEAHANAGGPTGLIDITNTGTGVHTVTVQNHFVDGYGVLFDGPGGDAIVGLHSIRNWCDIFAADALGFVDKGQNNWVGGIGFTYFAPQSITRPKMGTNDDGRGVYIYGGTAGDGAAGKRGGDVTIVGGAAAGDTDGNGGNVYIYGGGGINNGSLGAVIVNPNLAGGDFTVGASYSGGVTSLINSTRIPAASQSILNQYAIDHPTWINDGLVVYNQTTKLFQIYADGSWRDLMWNPFTGNFQVSGTIDVDFDPTANSTGQTALKIQQSFQHTSASSAATYNYGASIIRKDYNIASGVSDQGAQIAEYVSSLIEDTNFAGYLREVYGIYITHGIGENATSGERTINRCVGLNLYGYKTSASTINNHYGIYQESVDTGQGKPIIRNYLEGSLGIGIDTDTSANGNLGVLNNIYASNILCGYLSAVDISASNVTISNNVNVGGTFITSAGYINKITRITSGPYNVLATDHIIFVDTDGGNITVNLPVGINGTNYRIINCGTSGNIVTLDPNGSEQLFKGGAGVAETLYDGEVADIVFETTEGWM